MQRREEPSKLLGQMWRLRWLDTGLGERHAGDGRIADERNPAAGVLANVLEARDGDRQHLREPGQQRGLTAEAFRDVGTASEPEDRLVVDQQRAIYHQLHPS
jgi:hypothetical protein